MEKDILHDVADTITGKPYQFEIIILPQNRFHKWLQRIGWMPTKKEFSITPIVFGNLVRISKLLLSIDPGLIKGKNFLDISHHVVAAHADTIVTILAIAIQNNKYEPSSDLIKLIKYNLAAEEMYQLLAYVLDKMDLKNFISSIISIRGLNVLESGEQNEVSPKSQGS